MICYGLDSGPSSPKESIMKNMTLVALAVWLGFNALPHSVLAQVPDANSVRCCEAALAFAAGAIQKTTPRDGIVNLITGDNQTTGNRMILGRLDGLYLKLDHPSDAAIGDLYTVYRRVRKVFHPVTGTYLGFTTIRLAVVKVTQVDPDLTTVEVVRSFNALSPGDLVMRFIPPPVTEEVIPTSDSEISGMIVELQADKTMTMVSQSDVVYLDRGRIDGLKAGDLMDVYRRSAGLPVRKIGQLKILSTEEDTATAKIVKANTRVMKGDRYKLTGYAGPLVQPLENASAVSNDLVARTLKVQDAAGQSRINLGELNNFLHYDSGEAAIKPDSYKVLDQLIEYLHTSGDKRLIKVEGHADNVEIGPSLKSRYPSNWELSKARAGGVIRYLVEKGGLDSARLSSVGYGDSRPAGSNSIEEGRTKNRRVEILLYTPLTNQKGATEDQLTPAQEANADATSVSAQGSNDKPSVPTDDPGTLSHGDSQTRVDGSGTQNVVNKKEGVVP